LAAATHNIGALWRNDGEAAREAGRELEACQYFQKAKQSVLEALRLRQKLGLKPDEAQSHSQLADTNLLLNELNEAEHHANEAREIWEQINSREVFHAYEALAAIALARGDASQAAEWKRKSATLQAQDQQRQGIPAEVLQNLQALGVTCAEAGAKHSQLSPGVEAALAQIETWPAPLPELAAFLRRLAAGELPPVPSDLPAPLPAFLAQLFDAVRKK
jgi:tetratricopeptide (TPR) repeat protein